MQPWSLRFQKSGGSYFVLNNEFNAESHIECALSVDDDKFDSWSSLDSSICVALLAGHSNLVILTYHCTKLWLLEISLHGQYIYQRDDSSLWLKEEP